MQLAWHIYETLLVRPITALLYGLGFAGAATLLLSDLLVKLPAVASVDPTREEH
jgi:hypothetical protein